VSFINGDSQDQIGLLPACIDDYVAPHALVRVVDAFVASLDLAELGFNRVVAAATGRPGYQPGDMLRLYIWGYLNQVRSSRHLERAFVRDLEALWFDAPADARLPHHCRVPARQSGGDHRGQRGLRAVLPREEAGRWASCGAGRHQDAGSREPEEHRGRRTSGPRHCAHRKGDRLLSPASGHRRRRWPRASTISRYIARTLAPLSPPRRKDRLVRRQQELESRDEKVLVFGEPEAKPMGYGLAPKLPSYNLQSVVDVESGLIVHHDVYNDANDSHLLHPVSVAAKKVLKVDQIQVLTDGGYSNAEEVARCEREGIEVAAPIKRGAMNSNHFRPAQFIYDDASDTIHCPAGETLRPSGLHTRNRAIRYRTSACATCSLKPRCTPGAQRTIHRLIDQRALDRMEARIYADPSLMKTRRCTVEHPFGTIKRMSGGGRFLTRGLKAVKAEAALSILAFNIPHAVNAFGATAIMRS
jgi:Transposase DDE domain/Transposase domain (DUF772)